MNGRNPAGQVDDPGLFESDLFEAGGKLGLFGELADAFDEILIALAVLRDDFADLRDDAERILVIDFAEGRILDVAELQAEKLAAGFQDAIGFA